MINTKDDNIPDDKKSDNEQKPGYIDVAIVDVQAHILIRDKDTGEVLVNRRG